ncbi:membrane protein [Cenarchaeum symbiosum A]|uniref:Membrane protein n=1 Tax=Cenarchaeum symbiosum (strain A) TaxID=414004 RepID=A0RXM6_CENSY|nr:membrane protein [Cenarchaeum symbiosum A]
MPRAPALTIIGRKFVMADQSPRWKLLKGDPAHSSGMSQDTKVEKDVHSSSANRLLVICVDRDNDVGEKAGIATPVVGRDACIEAAQRLALVDPEDADSNAIFASVKTYEDLISKGYEVEVTTVAGVPDRGVRADVKIAKEVRSVLDVYSANGAVIVSDGNDDESVIPVIQNVLPVISVQRVVMRVSRSVEYSYAVFGKYLKMIAYDSRYSKFFLGLPGMLLLIGGVATVLGYAAEILAVLVSILGGAFLIRAFDVDKAWSKWTKPTPSGFVRMFTLVAGAVLMMASIPAGVAQVDPALLTEGVELVSMISDRMIMGKFVAGLLPTLWAGVGTIFAGILLSNWLGGVRHEISDTLRLVVLAALFPTVYQFTNILIHGEGSLTLVPPLLGGLAATLVAAMVLFRRFRRRDEQPGD